MEIEAELVTFFKRETKFYLTIAILAASVTVHLGGPFPCLPVTVGDGTFTTERASANHQARQNWRLRKCDPFV